MDDNKLESIIFGLKATLAEKNEIIEKQVKIYDKLEEAYGELVQENAEQKAEIERLNSKYKNLEINYNSVWEDYRKYEVENAEQKAEIERLKDENIEERDIHFKNLCGYKDEIARLQKKVDELKAENTELYKEHTTLIAGSLFQKQNTVKETAKEILEMAKANLDEHWSSGVYTIYNAIRNSYGVEVE